MKFKVISITILISILCIWGCSSSDPDATNLELSLSPITPSEMMVGDVDYIARDGYGIIGKYQVHVDIPSLSGELNSIRQTSSEDVLEIVDITNFLQLVPCDNCIELSSIALDSLGNLVLSIGIKHPFTAPNMELPPSAQNRADLHVFNIEGTVVIVGAIVDTTTFFLLDETVAPIVLINADGYSPYLDTPLDSFFYTTATVHPYILHFDDFSPGNFSASNPLGFSDITDPTGNLVMKQGSSMDYKDYVFDLGNITESLDFIFAVGCTYGVSADNRDQRLTPVYRLPQFNKKAATKAYISKITEIPPVGLRDGYISSAEILEISVLDMNYDTAVGPAIDRVKFPSGIAEIEIEIPGILGNLMNFPAPVPDGGDPRDPLNPLTFEIIVANELGAAEGIYAGLVKITDSYPTSTNISVPGDGISRVDPTQSPLDGLFDIAEYATYAGFNVDVAVSNSPPTGCYTTSPSFDPFEQQPVQFDATCSYDIDGAIILYEWDFDYDAVSFNVQETGVIVTNIFPSAGTFTVALRVTDEYIPALDDIYQSEITVVTEPPASFSTNTLLINNTLGSDIPPIYGIPVGLHYSDILGDTIFVGAVTNSSPYVRCLRSEDDGATWITPPGEADTSPYLPNIVSMSLRLTESGYVDMSWLISAIPNGPAYHNRATSAYNFQTKKLVTSSILPMLLSHSVYTDQIIYLTFSTFVGPDFEARLFKSTDAGQTWNSLSSSVNIPLESGASAGNVFSITTETDNLGTLHAAYIDENTSEVRYTQSTDQGVTFSNYVTADTISNHVPPTDSLSLAVSDDGEDIYIAYLTQPGPFMDVYCASSNDGGSSFSQTQVDDVINNNCDKTCIVLDPYGWIYVSFYAEGNNGDIRFTKSKDNNTSWPPSVLVNDDGASASQRAPSICVGDDMKVHVFWKDDRDNPGTTYAVYYDQFDPQV